MWALLDAVGPMIWRASWQGSILAAMVVVVLRCFGERLSARWRFMIWGVVIARLLCVCVPGSPWSVFNLAAAWPDGSDRSMQVSDIQSSAVAPRADIRADWNVPPAAVAQSPAPSPGTPQAAQPPVEVSAPAAVISPSPRLKIGWPSAAMLLRALAVVWLAGCLWLTLRLVVATLLLRKRLAVCRAMTDPAILGQLDTIRQRMGLQRTPTLLVTPQSISPCIAGTWTPRIIVPESVVAEPSAERLSHIFAHELAHLVRGDLWTNWLLLSARVLHWMNPIAWWAVREMQAEREAACDELAFAALHDTERSAYAATIVDLAASLIPSSLAPGFIGLFSSNCRLQHRIRRLLQGTSVGRLGGRLAACLLLGFALLGLTDAMPNVHAQGPQTPKTTAKVDEPRKTHTVEGRCVEYDPKDRRSKPMAGVSIWLYKLEGRTSPPVEIAKTTSGADGRYAFTGLVPPRMEYQFDRLVYGAFGMIEGQPIGQTFMYYDKNDKQVTTVEMTRDSATLAGRVVDPSGRPVAGAKIFQQILFDRPVRDFKTATTDADGKFQIEQVAHYKLQDGKSWTTSFAVLHPDFPEARGEAKSLPADVVVTLTPGCVVTGTIVDGVSGEPAAHATVGARRLDEWGEAYAATDAAGKFRLVLPEGRYDFQVDAQERVCLAVTDRECLAGTPLVLPPFTLSHGGMISGRVLNTATRKTVTVTERGDSITIGMYGPSHPAGRAFSPTPVAVVDSSGKFTFRAPAGDNYPYFINLRGDRMSWDTQKQPPVVVKEGETTTYDMLITPEVTPEERLKAAKILVEGLPKPPTERTTRIIEEFRKLNRTVDETELWCLLMRELVAVGREAVPQLCAELDATTDNVTLRRIAFALRAIGDPRAVPALIRAIPKTLLPSSSDFGLIVKDKELTEFMQTHDLDAKGRGTYFDLGRPEREISGALLKLTGQTMNDKALFGLSRSEDPRRQVLQRRLHQRQALQWQAWWEMNWQKFTQDPAYQKVNLTVVDEPLPPAPQGLGKSARLHGEWQGAVLSPPVEENQYAWHFYDLDTGYRPTWPSEIPHTETETTSKQILAWAVEQGVDLICITHREPDGTETFVLKALGMKVHEISTRDLRNIDRLISSGTLPEGRPVGELLMHYDEKAMQLVPHANGAFIFVTREGNMGLIEITDRVTRTADLTGLAAGSPMGGVGFHKGVRFNLKAIIP